MLLNNKYNFIAHVCGLKGGKHKKKKLLDFIAHKVQ